MLRFKTGVAIELDNQAESEHSQKANSDRGRFEGYSILAILLLAACWGMGSLWVYQDRQPVQLAELTNRVNPNTASAGSLMRLEGIGQVRAWSIVQYRQQWQGPGSAFKQASDLEVIHGIGPKTVEKLRLWLEFENE